MAEAAKVVSNPLVTLHELGRSARRAESARELEFLVVNDTRSLLPYRQAVLWFRQGGVRSLSGVVKLEANVPYVQWLSKLATQLASRGLEPQRVSSVVFPDVLGQEWSDWLPAHAVWIPLRMSLTQSGAEGLRTDLAGFEKLAPEDGAEAIPPQKAEGGLLFARDLPWTDSQVALIAEWVDVWLFSWNAHRRSTPSWWFFGKPKPLRGLESPPWWRCRAAKWLLAVALIALIPVRLTVLAPGELVPANPAVVRAPLDGVIETFHVQPNETVRKGQPLLSFDESLIRSRVDISRQALATAEAEYRQAEQQALHDPRAKLDLSVLAGKIAEKDAEFAYVVGQSERARVLAPQDGIVLFDDPTEWIGRPVRVGERILRVATLEDVEVEAWVSVADAIPLKDGARVKLFLSANPGTPVAASLRYLTHDAVQRPDMMYAYRLRASLDSATGHRVGMKGTAKLYGRWVPLGYWVFRRPVASVRTTIGW